MAFGSLFSFLTSFMTMDQLRRVSIVFAVVAFIFAMITGAILFFVIEPPFLVRIFVALSAIAIGCFALAGVAAYFEE
jgi:NADH:ubiquinone oxidoreductase subunit 6 (subunit J)